MRIIYTAAGFNMLYFFMIYHHIGPTSAAHGETPYFTLYGDFLVDQQFNLVKSDSCKLPTCLRISAKELIIILTAFIPWHFTLWHKLTQANNLLCKRIVALCKQITVYLKRQFNNTNITLSELNLFNAYQVINANSMH